MSLKKYMPEEEARIALCDIGVRMYNKGFVSGSDGNISVKISDNEIITTPTGVCKGYMTPDMLVKMDLAGNILDGEKKPSSEVKMHLRVYNENPDVMAVVHAHPPVGTAFAVAGRPLDVAYMAESVVYLGAVPCAEFALPGSVEVPDSIAPFCKDYNACFIGNHGTLTWGESLEDAYYRLESLENGCRIALICEDIMKEVVKPLPRKQVERLYELRKNAGFKRGGELRDNG